MIQYQHNDYDWYIKVQRRLTARKTNNGRDYFSWCTEDMIKEVNELVHQYIPTIDSILCHGCRCGTEVEIFRKLNPQARVYGTDLYGDAYKFDRTYFREMDFDTVPVEWLDYFDMIYSNSLDHSRNPINTLLAWKSELRNDGICFVNFVWGRGVSKEDCFHIDGKDHEDEIKDIAQEVGMKVLYIYLPYIDAYGNNCANTVLRKA